MSMYVLHAVVATLPADHAPRPSWLLHMFLLPYFQVSSDVSQMFTLAMTKQPVSRIRGLFHALDTPPLMLLQLVMGPYRSSCCCRF